jgi:hypothetical protein
MEENPYFSVKVCHLWWLRETQYHWVAICYKTASVTTVSGYCAESAFIIRYQQCQIAELQNQVFNLRQFLNQGVISTAHEKW